MSSSVGLAPSGNARRSNYFVAEDKDILNPVSSAANLALTFDLVVVTSWQEILTYRYSGIDGMLDCLCQLLRWSQNGTGATRRKFAAFNFSRYLINVLLEGPRLSKLHVEIEGDDCLCISFEASDFHPDQSGTVECRFVTPKAQLFLEHLKR